MKAQAFFRKYQVRPTLIPQSTSMVPFLRSAVDVASAMHYNKYYTLIESGVRPEELRVFALADHGVAFPEDGIYCLAPTWKKDPELCRNVREASLEGWRYAAAYPEEAVALIQKKADEAGYTVNRLLLWHMLQEIIPSIFPDKEGTWVPGRLSRQDYERTAAMMHQVFVLPGDVVPYEEFVPFGEGSVEENALESADMPEKGTPSYVP